MDEDHQPFESGMVDPQGGLASSRIAAVPATVHRADLFTPPGGALVWMIVFLELLTFGIGLIVFLRFKAAEPESFRHGQAGLGQVAAFVNTLLLLTGGWLMANALDRIRAQRVSDALRGMGLAAAFGVAFLIVKGGEYTQKFGQGFDLHHDSFHTMYWLLTGFHYLHVVVAVILLVAMAWGLRHGKCTGDHALNIESSAVFWHLCDLIWLLLMPVIYLLP